MRVEVIPLVKEMQRTRQRLCISQARLARDLDVSASQISHWEIGRIRCLSRYHGRIKAWLRENPAPPEVQSAPAPDWTAEDIKRGDDLLRKGVIRWLAMSYPIHYMAHSPELARLATKPPIGAQD